MTTADKDTILNLESLSWHELVSLKRSLSAYIKELTNNIIEMERRRFRSVNKDIHSEKNRLDILLRRLKQIRTEIQNCNSQLFSISESISRSKNFLSMMQNRIPSEKEDDLIRIQQYNQNLLDQKSYRNEHERNQIVSVQKDALMKLEAIKAIRTIKEQAIKFDTESQNVNKSLMLFYEEQRCIQTKIAEINKSLDILFESKRQLASDHDMYINKYNETITKLDRINARLDIMAEMRQKQRQEYGRGPPNDALFKVKETAKRKFQSGSKLSFEELKLLYSEQGL